MKRIYGHKFQSGFHIGLILLITILFLAEILKTNGKIAEGQTMCENIKLSIKYQSTHMKIGDKMDVLHYGLYADDNEIKEVKECLKYFEAPEGKVIIGYRPEPNIIIAISGFDEKGQFYFKPILNYEVNEKLWLDKTK